MPYSTSWVSFLHMSFKLLTNQVYAKSGVHVPCFLKSLLCGYACVKTQIKIAQFQKFISNISVNSEFLPSKNLQLYINCILEEGTHLGTYTPLNTHILLK